MPVQIVRFDTKERVAAVLHTDVGSGVLAAVEAEWGADPKGSREASLAKR